MVQGRSGDSILYPRLGHRHEGADRLLSFSLFRLPQWRLWCRSLFAGLGVREGIFIFLFTKAGASTGGGADPISLLFFFATLLVSVLGGIEYVRIGGKKAMEVGDDMPTDLEMTD